MRVPLLMELFRIAALVLSLAVACTASPLLERQAPPVINYDVIVVGGGPAGLSATSGLARVRRNVLMLDSGEYRNGPTRHMHDVIGNDGLAPAYFRALAREQISRYSTAKMMNGTVTNITNVENGTYFVVTDAAGQSYSSRKIVLATGLRDIMPSTPGFAEFYGKGIYWCPWCDGWEHRDQPFGILCSILKVLGNVDETRTLNKDIIAFVNGTWTDENAKKLDQDSPGWQTQLADWGVAIDNRTLASISRLEDGAVNKSSEQGAEYDKFQVTFTDGSSIDRGAFIASVVSRQRSRLGESLGVTIVEPDKMSVNIRNMRTNVTGVWAVGDANSDDSTNVPHAMWSGKRAAVEIHLEIAREQRKALTDHKRGVEIDVDSLLRLIGQDMDEVWKRASRKH